MRFYLHLMRVRRVAYFTLPEKLGEPCITLQKYEGGSHKTSLYKNEF